MQNDPKRIIQNIGKIFFTNEGLHPKGSRIWIDDCGWYLIIVEFQPSGYAKGTYLNLAIHYLWKETDHFTYDYGGRIDTFREFTGDAERFSTEVAELAQIAMRQIGEYRKFRDLGYARTRILKSKAANKTHELYNKMMVCGLCKDTVAKKYFCQLQKKLQNIEYSWEEQIYTELVEQIAPIINDPQEMYAYVVAKVTRQRDF